MKKLVFTFALWVAFSGTLFAKGITPYPVDFTEIEKYKKAMDDPRPLLTDTRFYKTFIPDSEWAKITYDETLMKEKWSEVVGFKAPDVVGKIVPEIKPGRYAYKDKANLPFDKLMPALIYKKFNPPGEGGPNHVMNFTEMEVVPTRQYYWSLPFAEATEKYSGAVKQDENGYIVLGSWKAGAPFPRPSGSHKAMQIVYNWERRYMMTGDTFGYDVSIGVDRNFRQDHTGSSTLLMAILAGRITNEPYGFIDKRAERNREFRVFIYELTSPRDFYGNVYQLTSHTDPKKPTTLLAYVNILRRLRKFSSSDKQDQAVGQDLCFDDSEGFSQAISPTDFPYDYRVIDEREMLMPAYTWDGREWLDSENKYEWKGLRFERRPVWVVEMNQRDPNYIYSKRILYFDRETLLPILNEYYDQKGRLYRCLLVLWQHAKPMGAFSFYHTFQGDFIDVHSTYAWNPMYPATWLDRSHVGLRSLMKAK